MKKDRRQGRHSPGRGSEAVVIGRNSVEEVLRHRPERVEEVLLAQSRGDSAGNSRSREIEVACGRLRIPVSHVPPSQLDELAGSQSHQGVVARVSPRSLVELGDLLSALADEPVARLLVLDGVLDPQNVGALLRAAECFGVHGVVWSKNRSAPLGAVVSKVSSGASELLSLCAVANLHRALEEMKKAGWWLVGADASPEATSLDTFSFPERTVLVVGSEGEGMHQLTEKVLDFKLFIPMEGAIASLNVSQATAVFLSEIAKQHRGLRGAKG